MTSIKQMINIYRGFDYVPLIGSATNIANILIKLFIKGVILPCADESKKEIIKAHPFYRHLKYKSFQRCILLALPFGLNNLIMGIYDFKNRKFLFEHYFLKALENVKEGNLCIFLPKAHKEIRDNTSIMLKIVKIRGRLLKFASRRLRDDYLVVKAAVTQDTHALRYAGKTQLNCEEIAEIASKMEGSVNVLLYCNERFKSHKQIIMNIFTFCEGMPERLELISEELQMDEEFMRTLILIHWSAYICLKPEMKVLPSIQKIYEEHVRPLKEEYERWREEYERWRPNLYTFLFKQDLSVPTEILENNIKSLESLKPQLIQDNLENPLKKLGLAILESKRTAKSVLKFKKKEVVDKVMFKKRLRELLLLAHPDKNLDQAELANAIFKCVEAAGALIKQQLTTKTSI